MLPDWVILAALAGLGSNALNFFSRVILKKEGDSTSWAWFFETFRLFCFITLAFFDYRLVINLQSLNLLFWLGITEFISVYLYMKMHKYSELSISSIASRSRVIWIPIIAFLFFGEHLTTLEYLGIVILFLGLSVAISPKRFFIDKGVIYANLAAIVIAINTVLLKEAIPYASYSVIMIFYCLPSALLFPIFMKGAFKRIKSSIKINLHFKVLASMANITATYLLLMALSRGDVSRVNAVYQSMMIFAVLAGIILLKEKGGIVRKILGSVITIAGVLLLT